MNCFTQPRHIIIQSCPWTKWNQKWSHFGQTIREMQIDCYLHHWIFACKFNDFLLFLTHNIYKTDDSILANEDICVAGTCCSLASFLSFLPDLSTRNNWFLWWSFWPLIAATFLTFLPWSVTFKFSRYLKSSSL